MPAALRKLTNAAVLALKGMVYGLTHLVPGIGGALILIVMGIYEQFVDAVGNLFVERNRWREHLGFLIPLGVGMAISMLVFSKVVTALADRYPVALAFFFMGLLIGTVPTVLRMLGKRKATPGRLLAFVAGLAVVMGVRAIRRGLGEGAMASLDGARSAAYFAVTSFVAGGASVTPGLDGSYVWMLFGAYNRVIAAIGNLLDGVIDWGILVPAGLGAVLGMLAFSKAIDTAIKRAPGAAYSAVLGLVVGALIGLWPQGAGSASILVSMLCFAGGFAAAYGLSHFGGGQAALQ